MTNTLTNTVQYDGVGVVSASQYNAYVQVTVNISTLRSFTGLDGMTCLCLGTISLNDGGQGIYTYSSSSTSADNGTTVIVPTGAVQGAWLKWTGTANV